MNTIKLNIVDNYLTDNVVLGYDGENRTTKLQLELDNIVENAVYRIEFSNGEFLLPEAQDGFLTALIPAEVLTVGEVDAQLVWTWEAVGEDGVPYPAVDKTNVAHWKVLDSVELSRDYEKAYPDALDKLLSAYMMKAIELRYNEGNRYVEWRYLASDTWFKLFSADDITEGASAYQIAVKLGFEGTEAEWLESLHGKDGKDGVDGKDGIDGFSPEIIAEETEIGVSITVTHKDAEPQTVTVLHGKDGKDGADGKDGYTPQKDIDYFDGKDGKDGLDGKDGYTPVKGVDYFDGEDGSEYIITEEDYQAIADLVLSQLVDGDNLEY